MMKFHYYPETDSLYIDLSKKTSVDSQEIAPGVVVDFDAQGNLVGAELLKLAQQMMKAIKAQPGGEQIIQTVIGD